MRDLKVIQHQFEATLRQSQSYPFDLNTENIIKEWYQAKEPYIKLFGNETRVALKTGIEIKLTEADLQKRFSQFMDLISRVGYSTKWNEAAAMDFEMFLIQNKDGFFNNRVVKEYPALKIGKGTKLLKCFKFFLTNFDECRWTQDVASRYIQELKITGNLYMSVDPLDYLTISENNSNWRSCHSLDGDFRAGNVSYMLDDTTLVVYLASENLEQLKCMPKDMKWNDKKWRMLIHTDQWENIIYFNRSYPFNNEELLLETYWGINNFLEHNIPELHHFYPPSDNSFKDIKFSGERDTTDLSVNFILGQRDRIYDMRDVVTYEGLGYDDLIYSPHYAPIWSNRDKARTAYVDETYKIDSPKEWDIAFHKTHDITIGKKCKCVKCGERDLERSDSFLCDECIAYEDADEDLFVECDWCGRRLYPGEPRFNQDGDIICETCNSACTHSGAPIVE